MNEAAELAEELSFWMYQAAWHRAALMRMCGGSHSFEPAEAEMDAAQRELLAARATEIKQRGN